MVIFKGPQFEDDSCMFVIDLQHESLSMLPKEEYSLEYINTKYRAFAEKDISKDNFEKFSDRLSLRDIHKCADVAGSIYTYTCEGKNGYSYKHILELCRGSYKRTRRCAITFADPLHDYLDNSKNTSCLNSIHYYKDNVTVYFRASDLKNELLLDLHMIYDFFIQPVGSFKTLTVMCSTAQNIHFNLKTLTL